MPYRRLPIPPHFKPGDVDKIWKVDYQARAQEAETWARERKILPAASDTFKICLVAVDIQNTFCIPGFELYVAGRSGKGAVDDNRRLAAFIYQNLEAITEISPTMDTHQAMQIFHSIYLVNNRGEHPAPLTLISAADVEQGIWKFNPAVAPNLGIDPSYGQRQLRHYVGELRKRGKYDLTVWPYHAMLGGIGHALVATVEEAIFFHSIARYSQPDFEIKGQNPLTEHYSVLGPEVLTGPDGEAIGHKNEKFLEKLMTFDAVIIAGQAKSHCVAWTIDDLLEGILVRDEKLVKKVYLLEDCTSPVVVPDVVDYAAEANAAFQRFADVGMHVVRSIEPLNDWPGIRL